MQKEEIFNELKKILSTEFEIDEKTIIPQADLRANLGLDSIDAIDLFVKMKEYLPAKKGNIDPMILRSVRTVQDVVDALYPYLSDEAMPEKDDK